MKRRSRKNATVRINQKQALELLDLVHESIRWSSVSMLDKDRYYAAGNAMWSLTYAIVGDRRTADRLRREALDSHARYLATVEARRRKEAEALKSRLQSLEPNT